MGALLTILFVTAWDLQIYGVTVWRDRVGRVADALHDRLSLLG